MKQFINGREYSINEKKICDFSEHAIFAYPDNTPTIMAIVLTAKGVVSTIDFKQVIPANQIIDYIRLVDVIEKSKNE